MRLRRRKQTTRIEMLPLMDVVFLLLVFFIYSMMSMTVHHGLQLKLPTSSSVVLEKQVSIAISVKRDGSVFIDKDAVTLDELSEKLKQKRQQNTTTTNPSNLEQPQQIIEPAIQIFAEDDVSYQTLFMVLDKVKAANFNKISLQATAESKS